MRIFLEWRIPYDKFVQSKTSECFVSRVSYFTKQIVLLHKKRPNAYLGSLFVQAITYVCSIVTNVFFKNIHTEIMAGLAIINIIALFFILRPFFQHIFLIIKESKSSIKNCDLAKDLPVWGMAPEMFNHVVHDSKFIKQSKSDYDEYDPSRNVLCFEHYDFCFVPNKYYLKSEKLKLREFFENQRTCFQLFLNYTQTYFTSNVILLIPIILFTLSAGTAISIIFSIAQMVTIFVYHFRYEKNFAKLQKTLIGNCDKTILNLKELSFVYQDGYFSLS